MECGVSVVGEAGGPFRTVKGQRAKTGDSCTMSKGGGQGGEHVALKGLWWRGLLCTVECDGVVLGELWGFLGGG